MCAKGFKCIDELVKHEVTGVHFDQPADLFRCGCCTLELLEPPAGAVRPPLSPAAPTPAGFGEHLLETRGGGFLPFSPGTPAVSPASCSSAVPDAARICPHLGRVPRDRLSPRWPLQIELSAGISADYSPVFPAAATSWLDTAKISERFGRTAGTPTGSDTHSPSSLQIQKNNTIINRNPVTMTD